MSIFNTLFISADYLKKNGPIQQNVDDDLLKPIIILAQAKYILATIGSQLYDKISTDIQTNSLSGNYQTLLENYIQPTLVQYCLYEGIFQIHNQITNKGVLNKSSENSVPSSDNNVIYLENKARTNGEYFSQRMINYLRANHTLFPELNPSNPDCSTIFPSSTQYFSGINIPPVSLYLRDGNTSYGRDYCF